MTRTRASAKAAGTRFETTIARYLAAALNDDRIERRARSGGKDRGDLAGLRAPGGGRVVAECKDTSRINLAGWAAEAETERGNDDALVGLGDPGKQWVTMTLADLAALLTGQRPEPIE